MFGLVGAQALAFVYVIWLFITKQKQSIYELLSWTKVVPAD